MPKGLYKHKSLTQSCKEKISKALKGKIPKFIPDNKGRILTTEHRKKISDTLKIKGIKPPRCPIEKVCRGKNHLWWRGGITKTNEKIRKSLKYKNWRKAVFKRDNYTCI